MLLQTNPIIKKNNLKYPKIKVFAAALAQKYKSKTIPVNYNFTQDPLFKVHDYFKSSLKYSLLSSSSVVFNKAILSETGDFDVSITTPKDFILNDPLGIENLQPLRLLSSNSSLKKHHSFFPPRVSLIATSSAQQKCP